MRKPDVVQVPLDYAPIVGPCLVEWVPALIRLPVGYVLVLKLAQYTMVNIEKYRCDENMHRSLPPDIEHVLDAVDLT
jgi:hypothetical protein